MPAFNKAPALQGCLGVFAGSQSSERLGAQQSGSYCRNHFRFLYKKSECEQKKVFDASRRKSHELFLKANKVETLSKPN